MKPKYWLLKTEPETYSFEQLLKDKKTNWDGVRNFQARNHLKTMATGDIALIYHSGGEKAVMGEAQVVREAYPDPDEDRDDWVQVDLKPLRPFTKKVPLSVIKSTDALKDLPLIKQSRLSVMPITPRHYQTLLKLGEARE